jgi:hypothetical protein
MAGNLTAMIASIFSGSAVTADPYYEYTTLLLPGNGTNGAQNNTFLDGSTNNFTITRNGNTTQGTFSPFSQTGWGNYFNGSSGYFTTPANAAFAFGTGDFTVEMFVNTSNLTTGGFVSHGPAATSGYWAFELQTGSFYWQASGVANILVVSASSYLSNSVWTHLCVSRVSGTIRMFANGTQIGSATDNTNYSGSSSGSLSIGRSYNNLYTTGYISNLRIVKGTGVTTVTVPTAPLTAISGTSILTCQSNRFVDNSSNAFALTLSGSPSVQSFSPFNPTASWSAATNGGSGYFDGNGDYLSIPNSANLNSTGDFTIEGWAYITSASSYAGMFSMRASTGTTNGASITFINTGYIEFAVNPGGNNLTTPTPLNQWFHVALVRSGSSTNNCSCYLNGTRVAQFTSTSQANGASNGAVIGRYYADGTNQYWVTGYLSNVRYVVGTPVYSGATITVPTTPLTAISGTQFLCNFTNAGIYDATSKNDLETVGSAQISTTQSQFGGSSIYLNGSNSWLIAPFNTVNDIGGTAPFTIEFWSYFNSLAAISTVVGKTNNSTAAGSQFEFTVQTNGQISVTFYYSSSAFTVTSAVGAITTGAWQYVAMTKDSSGNYKIFINGTQSGTTVTNTSTLNTPTLATTIGAQITTGNRLCNAYFQDFRITRGVARTITASPTAAFPTL